MIVGILFLSARLIQLFFLIPIIGMLSYLVHGYVQDNELTPTFVLVPFIVSTLAAVWALFTLICYATAKHNGYFLWFVDLCIFGGLIAGVYELGPVAGQNCSSVTVVVINSQFYKGLGFWANDYFPQVCNLLKASFALGIMEIIFFFWSSFLALWVHHHHRLDDERDRSRSSEKHYSRHSHRRGGTSGSRSRAGGDSYYDDRQRATSRSAYRSTRSYV